jgi:hypothetical protein
MLGLHLIEERGLKNSHVLNNYQSPAEPAKTQED